jgi:hypothetical protein
MIITKKHLSRRALLRGALGTAIALPMLDAMVPALNAQSKEPKLHFGAVYWPNGVLPDRWHPDADGTNFEFKPIMKPLEPVRDHLITISGLTAVGFGHMGASASWLNGVGQKGRNGEQISSEMTLDQMIAEKIGQDTPLPSIEVGTEDMGTAVGSCDGYACIYFNTLAWRNATTPLPVEINPRATFERMYGETGTAAKRLARLQYKTSMLDAITEETTRLQGSLGASDRNILSQYLDNIREVERRIQQVMKRSAESVESPAAPAGIPESFDEHMRITYDLMHLGFQGDISRVFTFLVGVEASNRGYPHIGVSESHHTASHHANNAEMMDKYSKIVTYHAMLFSDFVQKLKATPDGDGSLLDHSMLYFGSGMSNGNEHASNNPPAIVAGGANGRLKGGKHVHLSKPTVTPNVLVSLAALANVHEEKIGPSTGAVEL